MIMRDHWFVGVGLLVILGIVQVHATQPTTDLRLVRPTIGSGGGRSSGEGLLLNGTLGQADAHGQIRGDDFRLSGGYWSRPRLRDTTFLPAAIRGD